MRVVTNERIYYIQYQRCNIRTTSMAIASFNARDCTPLATCLEKHGVNNTRNEHCFLSAFFRTCEREYMNVHYNKSNVKNERCLLPHTMNVQCTFTTTPRWLHTTLNTNIFVCVVCCGGFPYVHTII